MRVAQFAASQNEKLARRAIALNKDEANISVNTEGPSINLNNDNFINKGRNVSDKQELINLVNKEGFNKIFNLIS